MASIPGSLVHVVAGITIIAEAWLECGMCVGHPFLTVTVLEKINLEEESYVSALGFIPFHWVLH